MAHRSLARFSAVIRTFVADCFGGRLRLLLKSKRSRPAKQSATKVSLCLDWQVLLINMLSLSTSILNEFLVSSQIFDVLEVDVTLQECVSVPNHLTSRDFGSHLFEKIFWARLLLSPLIDLASTN